MEKEGNICGRELLSYTPHGDEERLRACYMEAIETLTFGLDPACPSNNSGAHFLQLCCNPRMQQEISQTYQTPFYKHNCQSYDSRTTPPISAKRPLSATTQYSEFPASTGYDAQRDLNPEYSRTLLNPKG
jgi:hypothetical protein